MSFVIKKVEQAFIEFLADESEFKLISSFEKGHHVLKYILTHMGEWLALARHQAFNPASIKVLNMLNMPVHAFFLERQRHHIERLENHV